MKVCKIAGDSEIGLLWKRSEFVIGTKPRLYMPNPETAIIGCQRRSHGGGRVSMDQYHIRLFLNKHRLKPQQDLTCHVKKILPRRHDVQVVIRMNPKKIQDLVQHMAVLSGNTDNALKNIGLFSKLFYDGSYFYRLRASAKNK